MNQNQIKIQNNRFFYFLPPLIIFTGSFIYFGFFADYILFYQEKSSLFIFSSDFLIQNIRQPGGFLIWLSKLFSTFYYYPVAGGLIIAVILLLIMLSVSTIINLLTGRRSMAIPVVIGLILFYLQTDYRFLMFYNLGLLLQLLLFCIVIKYLTKFYLWIPVLLSPLWYFVTGGFAWIFFLMLIFWFGLNTVKNRWIKISVFVCINVITFIISAEILFYQSWKTLLLFPFKELNSISQNVLFISVICFLTSLPLLVKIRFHLFRKSYLSDFSRSFIFTLLTLIIILITGILRYDKKAHQYFCVEKLFYQNKFNEVIAYNTVHPSTNSLTIFLNNISLCEVGKLDDMLFNFPQSQDGKTLFLKWEMVEEILRRGCYFYYTIGMINEAHRWAYENMVMKGYTPEGLKMLIKTEIINGNYEMASRYISILKKTIFYKEEAGAFEKLLFNEPLINADKDLGDKRRNLLKADFFTLTDYPFLNIEKILVSDSLNKKAFEYKLAFLLLRKDYEGIKKELPILSGFGFTRYPVNLEEAAIAISIWNKGRMPNSGNIQLSNNTLTRWNQYLRVLQQYNNDPRMAEPALRRQFGNTFWYYAFYR